MHTEEEDRKNKSSDNSGMIFVRLLIAAVALYMFYRCGDKQTTGMTILKIFGIMIFPELYIIYRAVMHWKGDKCGGGGSKTRA